MRCIDLCCVWLLCVLFVVVCRLALRLVALCVVRCGLSSCVDLCVALRGRRDGSGSILRIRGFKMCELVFDITLLLLLLNVQLCNESKSYMFNHLTIV